MHRIRTSLPYFKDFGWDAEVVTVDERYSDMVKDDLLEQTVPDNVRVHKVKAFNKRFTSKFGLGSIALRSIWYYFIKVNSLLKEQHFDLIYFSTTQFQVCILGSYWKKKFGIPYVIDMQDPWHSDYYLNKPRHQRPKKFWFSYRLNKYLEPLAVANADGLISVSESYITDLKNRYKQIIDIPAKTITFGAFKPDLDIASQQQFPPLLDRTSINIVCVGRGGEDMHQAIAIVFAELQRSIVNSGTLYNKLKFYFIGTSYAPDGKGISSIVMLAKTFGLEDHVVEITDRISYYHSLNVLLQSDVLFIPGSDDPKYTASKIYPYLLTGKPILAIFHKASSALAILKSHGVTNAFSFEDAQAGKLNEVFERLVSKQFEKDQYYTETAERYSSQALTLQQCHLFDLVLTAVANRYEHT